MSLSFALNDGRHAPSAARMLGRFAKAGNARKNESNRRAQESCARSHAKLTVEKLDRRDSDRESAHFDQLVG
jgi:hypothetical protein